MRYQWQHLRLIIKSEAIIRLATIHVVQICELEVKFVLYSVHLPASDLEDYRLASS